MASTTFIDNQTTIYAAWLNDVNNVVYNGIFAASSISPTNLVCNGSVSGTGFTGLVNNTLSAPGAIGSVTPNTGAFTTLTASTPIAVSSGGTGLATLTANNVILGNGTSTPSFVAPGTSGYVLKSNGTTWVSGIGTKGLGLAGEIWNNVTGSRTLGATYTNSFSYPIFVSASNGVNNGPTGIQVTINGTQISSEAYDANGTYGRGTVWFIVPPGATYLVSGSASVQYWWELY